MCWWGCGETGIPVHCWWDYKMVQPLWKTVWCFLKKCKRRIAIWSTNSTFGYIPKTVKVGTQRDICTPMLIVALFAIANRWKHPNRWMGKKKCGVYIQSGILSFSLNKEGDSDTYYNMNESWARCATWNKLVTQHTHTHTLSDSTYTRCLEWSRSQKQKAEWWLPGAGGREKWGVTG